MAKKKIIAMECPKCQRKSQDCKDCKSINYFIKEINTTISKIVHVAQQMYNYRLEEFKNNEMEISAKEAEYIYQKCSKAELLLRTSNTILQESKKIKEKESFSSCADWIE